MAQTVVRNGVIYSINGDGTGTVVGYQDAPAASQTPVAIPLPISPQKARENQRQDNADTRAAESAALARAAAARAALEWQASHNPDGTPKQIKTFKQMPDSVAKRYEEEISAFDSLQRAVNTFADDFAGNTITGNMENWFQNRLGTGTPGQAQWWADFQATDNVLRNALFGASLTAGEKQAYEATSINPSMSPAQIKANLQRRMELAAEKLGRKTAFLKANGYDPDAVSALAGEYGNITGKESVQNPVPSRDKRPIVGVNGPGQSSVPPGTPPGGGPVMGLSRGENYTTPADLAVAAAVNKAFNAGGSVEDLVNAARSAGGQITPEDLANFNQAIEARKRGQGVTFNPQATGRRTPLQQAAGAAMTNPFGTAAADAVNMAGMGVLEGLLPDQYGAIRNINPNASMAGQIAGAIAGTEGLAAGARAGLNAVAPSLASRVLGGGAAAQAGRSLLTDTAFGAGYGGVTQGDPLTGAALAAGGSVLGQSGGKALGKVMSGVDVAPAAQALRDAGVPLTTGQTVGGIVKGVEDRLSGLPVVGDIVNARRLEGLRAFNEKAMGDAVAPINGQAAGVGNDGIQALYDQVGNAYDNATAGVNVPLDQQLIGEINALRNAGGLPPDYAARLNQALSNRLDPVLQTGQMSGDQFQQAMRGLKGYRASADKAAPGFEQDYRDVLSKAMDALNGQMSRGGGDSVVSGLRSADNAYRNVKTLDKAVTAARNGTGSGEIQIFTPAQLNNAATQAAQKFAGPRPFGELIDNAQAVLPNRVPDSGTAGRLATYALPTVLGGTGAGVGTLAGDTGTGTLSGLALAAALMAGGSKAGQKALEKVLTSRPGVVKKAGSLVRKKSGLFGAATIPPLLASQN